MKLFSFQGKIYEFRDVKTNSAFTNSTLALGINLKKGSSTY